jgi:putative transposase
VLKGIWYLLTTGCQWRRVPREFGTWNTLYASFKAGREAGVWARVREAWRQLERKRQGRQPEPSAGRVDSQSIKTATQAAAVGFDGGKHGKGRKRPLLVDTLGSLSAVVVTAVDTKDRVGLLVVITHYCLGGVRRLGKVWVDSGYQAEWLAQWVRGLKRTHQIDLEVTANTGKGFQVIPWRWAVEAPLPGCSMTAVTVAITHGSQQTVRP